MISYYCIEYGDDASTESMIQGLGTSLSNVQFLSYPEKLTDKLKDQALGKDSIEFNGYTWGKYHLEFEDLEVCRMLRHFYALKAIGEGPDGYGCIFENHVLFPYFPLEDLTNMYITDLNNNNPDWDIMFDSQQCFYADGYLKNGVKTYYKTNEPGRVLNGSASRPHYYIIKRSFAVKMVDNFFPLYMTIQNHYSYMFKKLNAKVYWAVPSNITEGNKAKKPATTWIKDSDIDIVKDKLEETYV